jgi:hypothetical protein
MEVPVKLHGCCHDQNLLLLQTFEEETLQYQTNGDGDQLL